MARRRLCSVRAATIVSRPALQLRFTNRLLFTRRSRRRPQQCPTTERRSFLLTGEQLLNEREDSTVDHFVCAFEVLTGAGDVIPGLKRTRRGGQTREIASHRDDDIRAVQILFRDRAWLRHGNCVTVSLEVVCDDSRYRRLWLNSGGFNADVQPALLCGPLKICGCEETLRGAVWTHEEHRRSPGLSRIH